MTPATRTNRAWWVRSPPAIPGQNFVGVDRCEYIQRRENVIAVGNSGTGMTHVALGLGLAACQRGLSVGIATATALVH